jgi:peptide/nickel transport system ATP-binding protein
MAGMAEDLLPRARPDPAGPLLAIEGVRKSFTLRSGWFKGKTRTINAVTSPSAG